MFMSAMALTAMFAAACSNEMVNAPETSEGTVLTAGFAPEAAGSEQTQTRTVLENDKTVKWTAGDRIAVNGKVSKDAEISETGVTAKFSFDDMLEAPYSAVFPAAALGISTRAVRKHLKFTVEQFRRHFGKHGK